mgnify:FL=1
MNIINIFKNVIYNRDYNRDYNTDYNDILKNTTYKEDYKLFIKSCKENNFELVEYLIKKYYNNCNNCQNRNICIHTLCDNKYDDLLKYVINFTIIENNGLYEKIDIYKQNNFGDNIYLTSCKLGNLNIVRTLYNLDRNINDTLDKNGNNSLIKACLHYGYHRNIDLIKFLVDKNNVNYQNYNGYTALMYASKIHNGNDIVNILLENKANMYLNYNSNHNYDNYSDYGNNAFILSVFNNRLSMKLLLMNNYKYKNELIKNNKLHEIILSHLKKINIIKNTQSANIFSLIVLLNDNYHKLLIN